MAEEPRRKRSIQSSGAGNELVIVMEPPRRMLLPLEGGICGQTADGRRRRGTGLLRFCQEGPQTRV